MTLSAFDWRAQPSETARAFHGGKRATYSVAKAPTTVHMSRPEEFVERAAHQARKRTTKFDVHAMYRYRQQGHTWAEVGEHFGCVLSNARRLVQSEYPETAGGYCMAHRLPAAEVEAMRVMRSEGATWAQIGKKFGLSTSTVYHRLTRSTAARGANHAV